MNTETEKVIKEYRFTVIVLGGIIVVCMVALGYILLLAVPDTVYKVTKQALNAVLDEREAEITQ